MLLTETCLSSQNCEFLYQCIEGICEHEDIFPLSVYTIFIYLATGLAAALCNVSGGSMGLFKMLILVIALNYELGQATGLAQAMVVGSALPNFFTIVFKKHPNGKTSLVNYRLIEIIIPCCLLGSTLGAILQEFIPRLGQLILLVIVFSYFCWNFYSKYRSVQKQVKTEHDATLISQGEIVSQQEQQQNDNVSEDSVPEHLSSAEYQAMVAYEQSHHFKDILISIILFIVFQFFSFLFQGKLPFYDVQKCSVFFPLGLIALIVITVGYIYWLKRNFKKTFATFRHYKIEQEIELDRQKQFYFMVVGAFAAGFIQSILGVGCGTCIMMVLLAFNMNTTAASATSAYQILFTGAAALLQFLMEGQIKTTETIWLLGVNVVLGGLCTVGLLAYLKRLNQVAVSKVLIGITLGLCVMSIILVIPTILRILDSQGWPGMSSIKFKCD